MKPFDLHFTSAGSLLIATIKTLTPNVEDIRLAKLVESPLTCELLARLLNERMEVELHAMRQSAYMSGYLDKEMGREPRLIFSNEWPKL